VRERTHQSLGKGSFFKGGQKKEVQPQHQDDFLTKGEGRVVGKRETGSLLSSAEQEAEVRYSMREQCFLSMENQNLGRKATNFHPAISIRKGGEEIRTSGMSSYYGKKKGSDQERYG